MKVIWITHFYLDELLGMYKKTVAFSQID